MKKFTSIHVILPGLLLVFALLVYYLLSGQLGPIAPMSRLTIGSGLDKIDLCQAIPQADIEAGMGRKLIDAPQPFEYPGASGTTSGCWYDLARGPQGEPYFGYIVLTPVNVYEVIHNNNSYDRLRSDWWNSYKHHDVYGLGDAAYLVDKENGATQLWVRVGNKVAFVVATNNSFNNLGAMSLARLLLGAIQ